MKRFFAVFVLTPAEQRVVILVVLLLLAGAWFKLHRDLKYETTPGPSATPVMSPSPNDR